MKSSLRNKFLKIAIPLLASKGKIKNVFFDKTENELLSFKEHGYLKDIGWINSFTAQKCVDVNNNPLPWVTYPFIDFMDDRLNKSDKVFEFGSGYSTLYYAGKVNNVISVEHDLEWYEKIKGTMPSNVKLIYKELEYGRDYCRTAAEVNEKFDIIIVDGRDRVNCCYNSLNALSERGVLVLDDSEREDYKDGVQFLINNNYRKLDFWGISPGLFYKKCTSIFYRTENILGI